MLIQYPNGNAVISLYENGSRTIEYEDTLELEQPLNIDIRVLDRCSNGYNPKTGKAICSWCHESQRTIGDECNYLELKDKLESLSSGIELAIGANEITEGLIDFIKWSKTKGFIVNLTVNQFHINKFSSILIKLIEQDLIKGLGISYQSNFKASISSSILEYEHLVLHCIIGIHTIDEILNTNFSKLLLLGYKEFGLGVEFYSSNKELIDKNIKDWQMYLPKLFNAKTLVSFDNLAIEQLQVKRFFTSSDWETFYQGEESIYINAVKGYLAPSSRTSEGMQSWNSISIKDYFKSLKS